MECPFVVGQKVVCVFEAKAPPRANFAQKGKIYTVRAIDVWPAPVGVLLRFLELRNDHLIPEWGNIEPGFGAYGFRPLITRKTDISIFTAMLHRSTEKVPA